LEVNYERKNENFFLGDGFDNDTDSTSHFVQQMLRIKNAFNLLLVAPKFMAM